MLQINTPPLVRYMLEKWSKTTTVHSMSHVKYGRTISGIGHEVERTNISKDEPQITVGKS
jgi:hypothetical protein